ncbi:hypothetical protein [Microbacterium sp. NPDC080220]|uniref:hypothetical protein n=1 Tax=Microbacterium sp. NPDC080220 TaxID=3161017 RepID=UPI0034315E48
MSTPTDVRIAALHIATAELVAAVESDDEVMILARLNVAGSALYALWLRLGIDGREQVQWAGDDAERRNVVGLVYARGEADHRGEHVAMAAGYGEAPYGLGPYGGGWLWRECPTDRPHYAESQTLYDEQVLWCPVAEPFIRALAWFEAHTP